MDFGVSYFPTDESIEPAALARMAEERGFESVFVTEHTHIPARRETPYPAGGELPREYSRIYDPFVALTTMADATERIRIGNAICLLVERDPITTAKAVASLDRLSGGRLLFGVGAGWNLEEMRNHGTDPAKRFRILRERVEACKEIWANEEASYHGEFVTSSGSSAARRRCGAPSTRPGRRHGPHVLQRVLASATAGSRMDPTGRSDDRPGRGAPEAGRGGRERTDPGDDSAPTQGPGGARALRAGGRHPGGAHAPRARCCRRRLGREQARRVDRSHPGIYEGGLTSIR